MTDASDFTLGPSYWGHDRTEACPDGDAPVLRDTLYCYHAGRPAPAARSAPSSGIRVLRVDEEAGVIEIGSAPR